MRSELNPLVILLSVYLEDSWKVLVAPLLLHFELSLRIC